MDDTTITTSELAIVIGSVREGRFGPVAASWVAGQATAHGGFDVKVVDLADYEIPLCLPAAPPKYAGDAYPRPAGMTGLKTRLGQAGPFILVPPEYNPSYPRLAQGGHRLALHSMDRQTRRVRQLRRRSRRPPRRPPPGKRAHRTARSHHPRRSRLPQLLLQLD